MVRWVPSLGAPVLAYWASVSPCEQYNLAVDLPDGAVVLQQQGCTRRVFAVLHADGSPWVRSSRPLQLRDLKGGGLGAFDGEALHLELLEDAEAVFAELAGALPADLTYDAALWEQKVRRNRRHLDKMEGRRSYR